MGTECCCKCGRFFDSRSDAGDTLYPGYKGNSWACYACHEAEHEKQDETRDVPLEKLGEKIRTEIKRFPLHS